MEFLFCAEKVLGLHLGDTRCDKSANWKHGKQETVNTVNRVKFKLRIGGSRIVQPVLQHKVLKSINHL